MYVYYVYFLVDFPICQELHNFLGWDADLPSLGKTTHAHNIYIQTHTDRHKTSLILTLILNI